MADTMELLGALLRRGMTGSSADRVEHSLGEEGIGGEDGILVKELGVTPARESAAVQKGQQAQAGSPFDLVKSLGDAAKSTLGEGNRGNAAAAGGLGALLGAIFGGGTGAAKGAIGGGALALLGAIALKALRGASEQAAQPKLKAEERLAAGLIEPKTAQEKREVQSIADLTVKAMINAAKADGRIDEDEMQKVVGELQADGISEAERNYLLQEVRKPLSTDEIVAAVPNRQVAAQIYAASLLAIEVDTPAEKAYLQKLASDLNLEPALTTRLHSALGVA